MNNTPQELITQLTEESQSLHGWGIDQGSQQASISGNLALEAAECIEKGLAREKVLKTALEEILDGYGMDPPDYLPCKKDRQEDWITEIAIDALKEKE